MRVPDNGRLIGRFVAGLLIVFAIQWHTVSELRSELEDASAIAEEAQAKAVDLENRVYELENQVQTLESQVGDACGYTGC